MKSAKILVFGKGGSGKSTVVTLLARRLCGEKAKVLVVDMDESNATLYVMLGLKPPSKTLTEFLGGRRNVADALFKSKKNLDWSFTEKGINKLPKEIVSWSDGLGLLVIGKISEFKEGCACPLNALAREFLKKINLPENEIIIVDTDAGIEHFGRGVEESADILLMVVDPTLESIVIAEKAIKLSSRAGKPLYFILNKVDKNIEKLMLERLPKDKVLAIIKYEPQITMLCLKGQPLNLNIPEIDKLVHSIKEMLS